MPSRSQPLVEVRWCERANRWQYQRASSIVHDVWTDLSAELPTEASGGMLRWDAAGRLLPSRRDEVDAAVRAHVAEQLGILAGSISFGERKC